MNLWWWGVSLCNNWVQCLEKGTWGGGACSVAACDLFNCPRHETWPAQEEAAVSVFSGLQSSIKTSEERTQRTLFFPWRSTLYLSNQKPTDHTVFLISWCCTVFALWWIWKYLFKKKIKESNCLAISSFSTFILCRALRSFLRKYYSQKI